MVGRVGCEHDWLLDEVLLEPDAADTTSTCTRCGATGYKAGEGRTRRPDLPEIEFTRDELRGGGAHRLV
jgi:hypothetical protein